MTRRDQFEAMVRAGLDGHGCAFRESDGPLGPGEPYVLIEDAVEAAGRAFAEMMEECKPCPC